MNEQSKQELKEYVNTIKNRIQAAKDIIHKQDGTISALNNSLDQEQKLRDEAIAEIKSTMQQFQEWKSKQLREGKI